MSGKRLIIPVSYSEVEISDYNWLKQQKNVSGLIRKLVREHRQRCEGGVIIHQPITQQIPVNNTYINNNPQTEPNFREEELKKAKNKNGLKKLSL